MKENLKILDHSDADPKKKNIIVTNSGWDSGLYKTLRHNERTFHANNDWITAHKCFSPKENKPRHTYEVHGTGWDSGLKSIPATKHTSPLSPIRTTSSGVHGYWNLENRKTLPHEQQHVGAHHKEYMRHVLEPRRRDMLKYHQRVCYV
jgi:hypothetical protein